MGFDQSRILSENTSERIRQLWLKDLSGCDGKWCFVSKVSTLRAELVMMLDLSDSAHAEIIDIFDKKLWVNHCCIYKIKSTALMDLQEKISNLKSGQAPMDPHVFNTKDEVLKFTLNQSTLLALGLICVIVSRVIAEIFENIYYINEILILIYLFSFFVVLPLIDKGTKKLSIIGIVTFTIIGLVSYVALYPKAKNIAGYLTGDDTIGLLLLIIFNFGLICCYLFSSLYCMNIFATNHSKFPKSVFIILAIIIYAVFIGICMQGFSTISISNWK